MPIEWTRDLEAALAEARKQQRVLLLDFTASPA